MAFALGHPCLSSVLDEREDCESSWLSSLFGDRPVRETNGPDVCLSFFEFDFQRWVGVGGPKPPTPPTPPLVRFGGVWWWAKSFIFPEE